MAREERSRAAGVVTVAQRPLHGSDDLYLPEPPRPVFFPAPTPTAVPPSGRSGPPYDNVSITREGAALDVARASLIMLAAVALGIAGQFLVVSGFQERAAQQRAFDQLRKKLAEGTAPLGQTGSSGHLLPIGTPIAVIDIPSIGVRQVVVFESTTSGVLMSGPGHSRGSPFPGQAGTSVVFGRQSTYGGPFSRIGELRRGAKVVVTTGAGVSTFEVTDVRRAGDKSPKTVAAGKGRLLLVTADGARFVPSGVLRVDADLVTPTLAGSPSSVPAAHAEQLLAGDPSMLWVLVLWLQALVVVTVAAVWSWDRWGHAQTWIVFLPLTALVGLFAANQFMKLMPNLL